MSLFNKIINKQKQEEEKKKKEKVQRIVDAIQECEEVMQRRGLNYYEVMDVICSLQNRFNFRLAELLTNQSEKIKELENVTKQPKENS